jgi:hypothetical protein
MSHTRFYKIFHWMVNRCTLPTATNYFRYGWRWIKCEWEGNFDKFRDDMYIEYLEHATKFTEKNTSLDRIDNDWNYCKSNCRWTTQSEQNFNRW